MSKTCPYPCPPRAASTGRDGFWIDQHTNQQLQSDNQYEGKFQGCIRAQGGHSRETQFKASGGLP